MRHPFLIYFTRYIPLTMRPVNLRHKPNLHFKAKQIIGAKSTKTYVFNRLEAQKYISLNKN